MIAIVDCGLGNLPSVRNALRAVGTQVHLTSAPSLIREATGIVLPGVGAASTGMERLRARGLDHVIRDAAGAGVPVLGICLGMQLLFEESEEGQVSCLGVIPGRVRLLRGTVKVPHIGWNQVSQRGHAALWRHLPNDPYFYFVHSYVCDPLDAGQVAGVTTHGETFCSAVAYGSIWGTQFHPERSGQTGLRLLRNFVGMCAAPACLASLIDGQ